jgi:hypothetical protein
MAYMARIALQDSPQRGRPMQTVREPDFSPLEWSVIRNSRVDRLWTIRPSGPVRRLWNWLIGRGNPELANPKLEALRKIAVLTWHFGFTIPGDDVSDFLSAGFSTDQYELMAASVAAAIGSQRKISA